ncbi:MAG: hypothetical protein ACI4KA_07015 [Oscillospiraceae bacterium]
MKKGSFSGLLYREWALTRKMLIIGLIPTVCIIVEALLIVLSFRYGNLAMIKDVLSEKMMEKMKTGFATALKLIPAIAPIAIMSDFAGYEINPVWMRFRRSTPASCFKLALAKYTLLAGTAVVAAVISIGGTVLTCAVLGEEFTIEDMAFCCAVLTLFLVVCIVMQICVLLTGSKDKGGLISMGILLGIMMLFIISNPDFIKREDMERFRAVVEKLVSLLPYIPVVFVGALVLGLVATTMIYKRREK